jgi:hypothetical protein
MLICFGCAPVAEQPKGDDEWKHLATGKRLFAESDFRGALREHEKVLSFTDKGPAAEEALLSMGLTYAHPANPRKDFAKAAQYFKRLAKNHPKSPVVEQARIILSILQENDELSRTIDRLNGIIEESKKVDIGIEDKKRGR